MVGHYPGTDRLHFEWPWPKVKVTQKSLLRITSLIFLCSECEEARFPNFRVFRPPEDKSDNKINTRITNRSNPTCKQNAAAATTKADKKPVSATVSYGNTKQDSDNLLIALSRMSRSCWQYLYCVRNFHPLCSGPAHLIFRCPSSLNVDGMLQRPILHRGNFDDLCCSPARTNEVVSDLKSAVTEL